MASDVTPVVRSSELVPESVANTVTAPCLIDLEREKRWWIETEFLAGVPPGDRVQAVHGPMGMPWFSVERIKQHKPGFDYTNTIDVRGRIQDAIRNFAFVRENVVFLDIASGRFVRPFDDVIE